MIDPNKVSIEATFDGEDNIEVTVNGDGGNVFDTILAVITMLAEANDLTVDEVLEDLAQNSMESICDVEQKFLN